MTQRLFISYRRADSVAITGRIYDRLVAEFGRDDLFKDVDSIGFGDFRKTIERALRRCHVVLVVIGSKWVDICNEAGERRLDHASDPVRIEVAAALRRMGEHDDVFVVPLLVDGARMPTPETLPADIRDLVYQNAFTIRHDPDFHGDIDRLIKRVRAAYPRLGGPASEPPPAKLRATTGPPAKMTMSSSLMGSTMEMESASGSTMDASKSRERSDQTPELVRPSSTPQPPPPKQRATARPSAKLSADKRAEELLSDEREAYLKRDHSALDDGEHHRTTAPLVKSGETTAMGAVRVQPLAMVRVPEGFTRLRSDTFTCGGTKHSVAIYRFEPFARALGLAEGKSHQAAEFALIPGGVFEMGSPSHEEGRRADESPRRRVTVPSFLFARTATTQRVWRALATDADSKPDKRGIGDWVRGLVGVYPPIEHVSWTEAMMWCISLGMRLPSESEWEFACRAGSTTRFCFGDDEARLGEFAWYDANAGGSVQAVALKKPNAFGLYDTHGGVWEWCHDTHGDYTYAPTNGAAAEIFGAHSRIVRGGGWGGPAVSCRSADRYWLQSETRNPAVGFRAACSLPM